MGYEIISNGCLFNEYSLNRLEFVDNIQRKGYIDIGISNVMDIMLYNKAYCPIYDTDIKNDINDIVLITSDNDRISLVDLIGLMIISNIYDKRVYDDFYKYIKIMFNNLNITVDMKLYKPNESILSCISFKSAVINRPLYDKVVYQG